ncbi:lymphocyte-specific protein 1 isoform X2 [Leopardus geoffroyi]|uniref:lymphocyte-specific protein 1 isoform X2 n=1 Tax=Leopardus geoffroyi TaxID=46844 RepID=UPI001E2619EC|nr:lymphocyte-specific protein 1 isoform X2 [Leopardus geoffroyi]
MGPEGWLERPRLPGAPRLARTGSAQVGGRGPTHTGVRGLTTQRSAEDEEEAARERRRRARDRELRAQDEDGGQSPEPPEQESLLSLKPSEAPELDEDEGFSDWSQKPEPQRQPWEAGGASNSGEPPRSESPEGQQEENRPHQHACGSQGGDEQSPARVSLEELHLSPSSELQDGPGTEETEPKSPEGTVQGSLGPAEAEEADEQHQKRQQPRTPSPLVLEAATEQGSPPLSPSTKLIDRTESLNRSIRKSNSVKKSQPALPISKIDERLEQYTQAIETAGRTPKLTRQPSIELPSMAVASTKSRWETGEVQAQSTAKTPSCKDIVAGDMSKRSLWEQKGGSKTSSTIKSTPSGKRYKFVATGHGKYEKVLVDEGSAP